MHKDEQEFISHDTNRSSPNFPICQGGVPFKFMVKLKSLLS